MTHPADHKTPALPEGFIMRAPTMNDAEAVRRLYIEACHVRGLKAGGSLESLHQYWSDFDLAGSARVVLDRSGKVVASVDVREDFSQAHPYVSCDMLPVPEYRGIMRALLAWADERAKQVIERCPPDVCIAWWTTGLVGFEPDETVRSDAGMTLTHYFNDMRLEMHAEPEAPAMPAGMTIRPLKYPEEFRGMMAAYLEAFNDAEGYTDSDLEYAVKMFGDQIENMKQFDPALWPLAVDDATGEIAGLVICLVEAMEDPSEARIPTVATRRAYRNRGIAAGLLRHVFRRVWQHGKRIITLEVDSESPTGANRLYEKVGMRLAYQTGRYSKEIRPAAHLAKQA